MAVTAAESFVSCLLQMAEAETNPVLEIIDLEKPLQENKKYPIGLLQFNQTGWRAYYHCHPASRAGNHRFNGEHGHFHIFVRIHTEPERWSHLVALAMDNMGQALGWFSVNHWVTGEEWESADVLSKHLKDIPFNKQITQLETWLLSLLSLSCDTVMTVLEERDCIIKKKQSGMKCLDIKKARGLYLLSERAINLEELIENKIRL